MTVYEMRTYTLHVGKMAEAVKLYTEFGYPALQRGGQEGFAVKFGPLLASQEVKLLTAAPWGPHP
jgi:hypothetical protein